MRIYLDTGSAGNKKSKKIYQKKSQWKAINTNQAIKCNVELKKAQK